MPRRRKDEKVLRPVHPNAGIKVAFRKRLDVLVEEMNNSILYWIGAQYRETPPVMALDDGSASSQLRIAINALTRQWQHRFDDAADQLAAYFSKAMYRRSDAALKKILKDAGLTVKFKMTPAMRDILKATITEQVGLIKSIPQQYLVNVQGSVMRSVQTGRDLGTLTKEITAHYGVTKRRAALIARDQNNKATANFVRARQVELGIREAVWLHSHGGKVPRPTHYANSGKRYDPERGWFDPDPKVQRHVFPGELINCFPSSTNIEFAHDVKKAYRRWFRGDLTEIVTENGKTLRATPNHPILTPTGWLPIGSLNEGDHVIELSNKRINSAASESDKNQRIPLISEIFSSLNEGGISRLEISLRDDFHGDGADGNVDIVFSARKLSFGWKLGRQKCLLKFWLAMTNFSVPELSFSNEFFNRCLASPSFFVRSLCKALTTSNTFAFHADEISGTLVARSSARFDDVTSDRSSILEIFSRKRKYAATGLMLPTQISRIISVRKLDFRGHVFNLETGDGWYVADGIIVHNCRCVSKSVIKGFS